MSSKTTPVDAVSDAAKSVRPRSLHVPVPAVLAGLGLLAAGSAHAATYNDSYTVPTYGSLSVNVFSADAANNPNNVVCTQPTNGRLTNVAPNGDIFYQSANVTSYVDTFTCTGTDALGPITANVQVAVGQQPVPPLPAVSPIALGGLAAVLAFFGLRRRRNA